MKVLLILDFPSQTPCLAKFLFWSYLLLNQINQTNQIALFLVGVALKNLKKEGRDKYEIFKCNISKEIEGYCFLSSVISLKKLRDQVEFPTSCCYCFWWVWLGLPKVPKISL